MLNPGPGAHGGFDPGDRVVAVANHIDEGFANGEVGTVSGPVNEGLVVTFADVPVTVPGKLLGDLRHGWAMTVHRARGPNGRPWSRCFRPRPPGCCPGRWSTPR